MALNPFIADALTVRTINAFLHTAYRIEDIEDWPDHRIEELESAIAMLSIKS